MFPFLANAQPMPVPIYPFKNNFLSPINTLAHLANASELTDDSDSEYEEENKIVTYQKESPYSLLKKKYDELEQKYTDLKTKYNDMKNKRKHVMLAADENYASAKKTKANLIEISEEHVPTDQTLFTAVPLQNNDDVRIYNYEYTHKDGHNGKAVNGKAIYMDIDWSKINSEKLKLCIYVTTSMKQKGCRIASLSLVKKDGNKIKISKIRDRIKKWDTKKIAEVSHYKYYINIEDDNGNINSGNILLYSKTRKNVGKFEPDIPKSYYDISYAFFEEDRFTIHK